MTTTTCTLSISDGCGKSAPLAATAVLDPKCFNHLRINQKHACDPCQTTLAYREESLCIDCGRTFRPALAAFTVRPLA